MDVLVEISMIGNWISFIPASLMLHVLARPLPSWPDGSKSWCPAKMHWGVLVSTSRSNGQYSHHCHDSFAGVSIPNFTIEVVMKGARTGIQRENFGSTNTSNKPCLFEFVLSWLLLINIDWFHIGSNFWDVHLFLLYSRAEAIREKTTLAYIY